MTPTQSWWSTIGSFGVGVVVAALITAWATRRRESNAWLRAEQLRAYETFYRAAWAFISCIQAGEVARAMQEPLYPNLESARAVLATRLSEVWDAARDVQVVGRRRSTVLATRFAMLATMVRCYCVPIRAGVTKRSLELQQECGDAVSSMAPLIAYANRADLGVGVTRTGRWALAATTAQSFEQDIAPLSNLLRIDDPATLLREYNVQRIDGVVPNDGDWRVDPGHWSERQLAHAPLRRPISGFLLVVNDVTLVLEISASLGDDDYHAMLFDAARAVQAQGAAGRSVLHIWTEMRDDNSVVKLNFWPTEDLPRVRQHYLDETAAERKQASPSGPRRWATLREILRR